MPGLGDIRGHVRRGLTLKASTSNDQRNLSTSTTINDLKVKVNSDEGEDEEHKVGNSNSCVVGPKYVDMDEDGTSSFQTMDLYNSFDSTVTLIVGENRVQFKVHKRMLCNNSPFFNAACKRVWLQENTIDMPEDGPIAVRTMLYWIYHNQLGVPERWFQREAVVGVGSTMNTAPGLLAKVYVLADKYQMKALMNDTVDALVFWHQEHMLNSKIPAKVVHYIFETLPDCSSFPFAQYLTYLVDQQYQKGDWATAKNNLPSNFLFAYCSDWTLLKRKHHVRSQLEAGSLIHKLLSQGMGPRAAQPKKYVMIPENQGY